MSDKPKNKGGAPKQRLPDGSIRYDVPVMCQKIAEYTEANKNGLPILKECCLENNWSYDTIMDMQRNNPMLAQSIKKLLQQKEINLEKGAMSGKFNTTMAIFSLKQPAHGWRDKWENEESNKEVLEKLDDVLSKFDSNIT